VKLHVYIVMGGSNDAGITGKPKCFMCRARKKKCIFNQGVKSCDRCVEKKVVCSGPFMPADDKNPRRSSVIQIVDLNEKLVIKVMRQLISNGASCSELLKVWFDHFEYEDSDEGECDVDDADEIESWYGISADSD
jgi:hypothetical protein